MIDLTMMTVSRHFTEDRTARAETFKEVTTWDGGWGKVVAERKPDDDVLTKCLTSKGIVAVVSTEYNMIVTAYLCTIDQAFFICHGKVPQKVLNRIKKNADVYRRVCGINYEELRKKVKIGG